MNQKAIITAIIVALFFIAGYWIGTNSPWNAVRPVSAPSTPQMRAPDHAQPTAVEKELLSETMCPEEGCGKTLAECTNDHSQELRSALHQLASAGMDKQRVIEHLKMMGFFPGETGLPQGHPPIGD